MFQPRRVVCDYYFRLRCLYKYRKCYFRVKCLIFLVQLGSQLGLNGVWSLHQWSSIHCLQLHGSVDIVVPSPQTTVLIRKQVYWIQTCGAVSMCTLVILHIFELAEAAAGVSWNGLTVPANYGVPSCIWQRLMWLEMKRCVPNATAAKCQSNYCQLD